ncbi:hypothetical protein [Aestuariivirga sp.]|uniref:hypothetical protein n=1 Tax=Aestuariivirga sp. TaxID=2650926 RepID=UPI0030187B85
MFDARNAAQQTLKLNSDGKNGKETKDMSPLITWIANEFTWELIKQAFINAGIFLLGLVASRFLYSWYMSRQLREPLARAFRWYAASVYTIESRLRKLTDQFRARPERTDEKLRRLVRLLEVDVSAALAANDQLRSALDMPLRKQSVHRNLAAFAASSARLFSELERSAARALLEIENPNGNPKYLDYLLGDRSPVTDGTHGLSGQGDSECLRELLRRHYRDVKSLAKCTSLELMAKLEPGEIWDDWAMHEWNDPYWDGDQKRPPYRSGSHTKVA